MTTSNTQPDSTVTIKTTVTYNEKSYDTLIKIDAKDIVNLIKNRGAVIANKAIQDITGNLYRSTNEKIKEAINVHI